jgi:hypothetical protein
MYGFATTEMTVGRGVAQIVRLALAGQAAA